MNKKRVLAMLLAGAMALSMTACGGNSASTDGSSNDGGASASGGSYKVSVILKTLAAEYWQYVKSGAEDYASEHSDKVTVEVKGPSSETAFDEMQNMIETDLSSGSYDGVIISPLQSDTAAQLVSGTKLPIVAIDTNFTAPEVKSFVGTGNEAAAKKGGEAAVEAAKAAGADYVGEMDLVENTDDMLYLDFHYCPLVKAWQKAGCSDEEIARLCDIAMCGDHGIGSCFDARLELPKAIAKGDDICALRYIKSNK